MSLFSIDPSLKITSSGLKYPLKELPLSSWWRGTLNEAAGDRFTIEFASGQVIVFMEHA